MFWLSFADPNLPKGAQFLGASIIRASHFLEAVKVAHALGINPGGECKGVLVPVEMKIPGKWVERLLNKEECLLFDEEMGS